MKKYLSALAACLLGMLTVCASEPVQVGVSLPFKTTPRWVIDGKNLKRELEANGFRVHLQNAVYEDALSQVNDVENMIDLGCKILVIAPVDGEAFRGVLGEMKKSGISVVAYDRLIMGVDDIASYVSFDNFQIGATQAEFIKDKLDLDNADRTFNIEIFTGAPNDPNTEYLFTGAMSVLQPYINSGKVKVLSGRRSRAQCSVNNWSSDIAQAQMEKLINSSGYAPNKTKLDAVLCQNDSLANGVTAALLDAGYIAANFPLITGQDGDIASVVNVRDGFQAMTIFKDTRVLAKQATLAVKAIAAGGAPVTTTVANNKFKDVPTYFCPSVVVTKDNLDEVFIKSGYYKSQDLESAAKK